MEDLRACEQDVSKKNLIKLFGIWFSQIEKLEELKRVTKFKLENAEEAIFNLRLIKKMKERKLKYYEKEEQKYTRWLQIIENAMKKNTKLKRLLLK